MQDIPTSEWMSKAKSSAEAPDGSVFSSPFGVNTKISSEKRFNLK
jgi:hypothetical protein